jgi:phosphoenolpyruvate synthase/pyruvate phosphate dikinase
LAAAAAGFGYVEDWEWRDISPTLKPRTDADMSLNELNDYNDHARRMVEWGTGMVRANYADVLKLYGGFEPLSIGFIDDKVRASVLLPLGDEVSELGDLFSRKAGFSNKVMNISAQSSIRGLNPGYAMGELVVTDRSPEEIEVASDKIYVFDRPPADLKPVAGIATVTEGNMVSHVQLLARNLGIPNAVLSKDNLKSLMAYNGKMVFYAVSNKGTVILKPASEMTAEEQDLFSKKIRSEEKITVPIELMELSNPHVLNLREVNAKHSGRLCGPKAANLGQLKQMYPTHVVEGLVIPFSIFRMHFDQDMPGTKLTYWGYLKEIFSQAEIMTAQECSEADIEIFTLQRLEVLRASIKKMPLKNEFKAEMKDCFREVLGSEIGGVPVFLRSDTNMEDLKDFTGAGLNLTLFNVLDQEKIWEGIKDVWASPYTERSYRWRQRYLLNPENVFPSILIIPSVNADYSGVMITKGVSTGNDDDITVAFNRGVGGAVEGQASESWLLKAGGKNLLLSPAREPEFTSIPATGGTEKLYATLEERLLTDAYLKALRTMAGSLKTDLKALGIKGPYDVELGFKDDKIWLFQVRPFVENKKATASDYLRSITPEVNGNERISLNSKIK